MSPVRPILQIAHQDHVLLDTLDRYDAWNTGRDGPEDAAEGGLRIAYEGSGSMPEIVLYGTDGEVGLCGISEIKAAEEAIRKGRELAEKFGPPLSHAELQDKRARAK